jgi:DNA-binding transcriptional ArsR family regulator
MDLSDPTRAITSTLDGAVLAALAASGKPLTVGQVAQQARRGSEIGVRRSLARLIGQGIVRATLMGRNQVHELNRDHLAAPVAMLLAGLRTELWARLRKEFTSWRPRPLYACVFGSAARADGDEASDIDLLLVHPPFPGEDAPPASGSTVSAMVADALGVAVLSSAESDPAAAWERQVDRLRDLVEAWTGNSLQVVDLSFVDWRHPSEHHRPLLREVQRDGVDLVKPRGFGTWPTVGQLDGEG